MKTTLLLLVPVIIVVNCNICFAAEPTIDFEKLFDTENDSKYEKTIEDKITSEKDANAARSATQYINTPMTWVGVAAKEMFTCDDCPPPTAVDIDSSSAHTAASSSSTSKLPKKGVAQVYRDGKYTVIVCNDGRKRKVHHDDYGECQIPSTFGSYPCDWAVKDTMKSCN